MISTDPRRRRVVRNGLIEHAAGSRTVDAFTSNTESDDEAGEYIDDDKDPMATQQDRLTPEQIDPPVAILGLGEEGEPGRTRGARNI